MQPDYDLCVIGGGINGAGIARDAAGRGLVVLLVEAQDLAQATSSASTKLIHGGLRYLEHGEFRLVRESLKEREILLSIAPHLIRPMDFVMPHVQGLRPRWIISLGLWLYDHLAGRKKLKSSTAVGLNDSFIGQSLKPVYKDGFQYSDCWADDSRLVVLNAMDAKARGAEILTRTACVDIAQAKDIQGWHVRLKDLYSGDEFQISAKAVVNAAGPWVRSILDSSLLAHDNTPHVRLVKGSHIIIPKIFEGEQAYLLQQPDKRIVFAIPYETDFTLVGTTDVPFEGDAMVPVIDEGERQYLCDAINRFFEEPVSPDSIFRTYSGVRALFDDGAGQAQKITRDYHLELDVSSGSPILSVFGGKLTTYRVLARHAVDKITGAQVNANWTAKTPLPGGDIDGGDVQKFHDAQAQKYPFLSPPLLIRLARSYGTRMDMMLEGCLTLRDMGRDFGELLYEVEILYLIRHEFAKTAEDILWRRTKLGLHLEKKYKLALEAAMPDFIQKAFAQ